MKEKKNKPLKKPKVKKNRCAVLPTIKKMFFPWLLCFFIMESIIYLFTSEYLTGYIFLSSLYIAFTMIILDYTSTHKLKGTIIFFSGTLLKYGISVSLILIMMSKSDSMLFIFAIVTILSGFVAFSVYYFSIVSHRFWVVFLVSLIPCAFYVTAGTTMSTFFCITIIVLDIVQLIISNRQIKASDSTEINKKAYFISYADFIIATTLLCVLIPKPQQTYNKEFLESLNMKFGLWGETQKSTSEVKDTKYSSGSAYYMSQSQLDTLIMTVNSSQPVYLKNKVFDVYLNEKNCWTKSAVFNTGYNLDNIVKGKTSADYFNELYELFKDTDNKFGFYRLETPKSETSKAVINSFNFKSCNLPYCGTADSIQYTNYSDVKKYICDNSEIFPDNSFYPDDLSYLIRFTPYNTKDNIPEYEKILNSFLTADKTELSEKEQEVQHKILDELSYYSNEMSFSKNCSIDAPESLKAIANTLTADCKTDFAKAVIIEKWFRESGDFVYDLEYKPPQNHGDIEYFVLESKKGSCSDYATAFALMADYLGIPTRYVEGFTMSPADNSSVSYNVYLKNSHAYCECYFPAYGWIIFEPTPDVIVSDITNSPLQNIEVNYNVTFIISIIVAVALIIAILLTVFRKQLQEAVFRIKIKKLTDSEFILSLYKRILYHTKQKYKNEPETFTPQQLCDFICQNRKFDLSKFTDMFTKSYFGGLESDRKTAYNIYKQFYKNIKKRRNINDSTDNRSKFRNRQ